MNRSRKREIMFRFVGAGAFSVLLAIFLLFSFGASAAEKVVLQLRWDHQFQFAGYYAALWQGYYADAGLEVDIRSGFGEDWKLRNSRAEVAGNHAEFGVTGSDLLFSSGNNAPLVVLASFYQESPLMIYGLEGVKLDSPADLKGLKLGLFARGNIGETEIKIMLSKAGLDPERDFPNVTIIKQGLKDIIEGRVDVAVGYSIELNWFERLVGGNLKSLKPSTYGVNFYGDTLFTRRSLVEQKPELVEAFVEASIKGWRYALIHGLQVADRIARDLPRRIPVSDLKEFNRSQIKPVTQLTHFPVVPLGHSDPERWRHIYASLKTAGLVAGEPPGREFVYDPQRDARDLQRTMIRTGVIAVVVVLAGILAGIAWIIFLRRAVAARTAELDADVTKRIKAENTLLASEHALRERVADLEEAHRKLEMQGESLVRLADDLLVARDEARAADRAKSEFLASMSHELRTPLNAVLGFSELIKDETFGPVGSVQYRDYAEDIHDSGQHLLGLINDILDLAKIEAGKDELQEDEIEIPEIIRSTLKLVGHRAEQGGVKLELELPDPLPALRADERKLKQILVNLLSNAVKFTGAGGVVTLRAWCRMGSGYVFQIVDTGIGIAPEDIPKALARFGQVDADLNRQYEGTGLGLPLTKALVELHGGVLDLQSEVGVGTTVTVRFPAERIVASLDNSDSLDVEDRAAS